MQRKNHAASGPGDEASMLSLRFVAKITPGQYLGAIRRSASAGAPLAGAFFVTRAKSNLDAHRVNSAKTTVHDH